MQMMLPLHDEASTPKHEPQLPAAFDIRCKGKGCKTPMEQMRVVYMTRHKPFATYQCPKCNLRLMLVEAPRTPHLIWSDDTILHATEFDDFIEEIVNKRPKNLEVRRLRYGEI